MSLRQGLTHSDWQGRPKGAPSCSVIKEVRTVQCAENISAMLSCQQLLLILDAEKVREDYWEKSCDLCRNSMFASKEDIADIEIHRGHTVNSSFSKGTAACGAGQAEVEPHRCNAAEECAYLQSGTTCVQVNKKTSNIPSNISPHIRSCSSEACLKRMICYLHLALSTSLHLADIDSGRCRCCRGRTFVDGMNGISRLSEIWISETRHIPLSWDPDFQRKLDDVFFNCHCDIWSYNCLRPWLSGPFVGTLGPTCLSCEPNGGRARGRPDSPEVYSLAYLSVDCYMDKNYDSLTFFDFTAVHLYSCGTFLSSTGWWYWVIIFRESTSLKDRRKIQSYWRSVKNARHRTPLHESARSICGVNMCEQHVSHDLPFRQEPS